jgi:hypothetical protein
VINGVDDLLAAEGPDRVLELFAEAQIPPQPTQSGLLVELADEAELFHTPDGEAYATLTINGHAETWMARGRGFRRWLVRKFYKKFGKPPGAQALQEALGTLEAKAQFDSRTKPVFIRVAQHEHTIYFDLCDDSWQVVEITAAGWRVTSSAPIHFRRAKGMTGLPRPVSGGTITQLRRFINIGGENNWNLCMAWLVAACHPAGPYPVLVLQGEQGSAKSTLAKILRKILDPSVALVRTPPREDRDLLIAANNSWVVAFDNLSHIPPWLSDGLCRLATGGGFTTRELYTDSDEILFDAMRPVILNGIDQLAERADLADRALIINLPQIGDGQRKDEKKLYSEFKLELPQILGCVFDAVACALKRLPDTKLDRLPRMADFALWATAAEEGLGLPSGSFMEAYSGNRADAIDATLDADPIAMAILAMVADRETKGEYCPWQGTCGDLLNQLELFASDQTKRSRSWPNTPRGTSSKLKRLVTFLREIGIEVTLPKKGTGGERILTISRRAPEKIAPTATTAAGQEKNEPHQQFDVETVSGGSTAGVANESPLADQPPPNPPFSNPFTEQNDSGIEDGDGDSGGRPRVGSNSGADFVGGGHSDQDGATVDVYPKPPARPCYFCRGASYWQDRYGNWKCSRCHPPAPESVAGPFEVKQ